MLLEALARNAADDGDAERIGTLGFMGVRWLPGPHLEQARAHLPAIDVPGASVASVLRADPGAAARLAALARAGLVALTADRQGSLAPPPRRSPLVPRTAPDSVRVEPIPGALEPGIGDGLVRPEPVSNPLRRLPSPDGLDLGDALQALEAEILLLERDGAPPHACAAAWRRLAHAWQRDLGALDEATRCMREAAAADPTEGGTLAEASDLCHAMGRSDLASAYAAARVSVATDPRSLAAARTAQARLALRSADVASALEALAAAAATDPGDVDALELDAHLRRALGQHAASRARAMEAAARLLARVDATEQDSVRAWGLLWWAATPPRPSTTALAALAELALRRRDTRLALALWRIAAARQDDALRRREVRLEAAERAEALEARAEAAALLLDALDEEPDLVEALADPLAADLDASGDPTRRATVLLDIALRLPDDQRAAWFARAARAMRELPGGSERALELAAEALRRDPSCSDALELVVSVATDERMAPLAADTLERVLHAVGLDPAAAHLARALAHLERRPTGSPTRRAWAWRRLHRLDPDNVEAARHVRALGPTQTAIGPDCTAPPADDPELRSQSRAHYEHLLARHPHDLVAAAALERIAYVTGDDAGRTALLREQARRATKPAERAGKLLRLATRSWLDGRIDEVVALGNEILALLPGQSDALALVERASRRLGLDAWMAQLERTGFSHASPPVRADALARLAIARLAYERPDALAAAREAVRLQPDRLDAWFVIALEGVAHPENVPLEMLERAAAALGDPPVLLAAIARAAPFERSREAARRWCAASPLDPQAYERLLEVLLAREAANDVASLAADLELVLASPQPPDRSRWTAALERVASGFPAGAARLGLRSLDAAGRAGDSWLEPTVAAAERSGREQLLVAALERVVARHPPPRRTAALLRLADLHAAAGRIAACARCLIRVLEREPHDEPTLARLTELYARAGDAQRLVAVLALRFEAATDAYTRRARRLDLVEASVRAADLEAARQHALALEASSDPEQERERAEALVAVGEHVLAVHALADAAERCLPDRSTARKLYERAVRIALEHATDGKLALDVAARALNVLGVPDPTLLPTFERLALQHADFDRARRVYAELCARAPGAHGRRGILYRSARWLERAGADLEALEAYRAAFDLNPRTGPILAGLERTAMRLERPDVLVAAVRRLAAVATHPAARTQSLRRAAELLASAGRSEEAFDLLFEAFREDGARGWIEPLRDALRRVQLERPTLARERLARLRDALEAQAREAWDDSDRARLWMLLAEIEAREGSDAAAAARAIEHARRAVLETGPDPDLESTLDACRRQLRLDASALVSATEPGASPTPLAVDPSNAPHGPERDPAPLEPAVACGESEPARWAGGVPSDPALREPLASTPGLPPQDVSVEPTPRGAPEATAADATEPPRGSEHADGKLRDDGDAPILAAVDAGAAGTSARVGEARLTFAPGDVVVVDPHPGTRERELRERWLRGDANALLELVELLAGTPRRLHEAHELLLSEARRDPCEPRVLELLASVARRLGAVAIADVAAQLAAFVAGRSHIGADDGRLAHVGVFLQDPEPSHRRTDRPALRRLFELVWTGAAGVFRRSMRDLGLVPAHRIDERTGGALGRCLAHARELLGPVDAELFVRPATTRALRIVPSTPPAIVFGPVEPDLAVVRARLGRAVELCRADNVLVATQDSTTLEILCDALRAAFGPPPQTEPVRASREALALAAHLCAALPTRAQRRARELLEAAGGRIDPHALQREVWCDAARAALVCAGDPSACIEALLRDDPSLCDAIPADPESVRSACAASEPLAALLRFALEDGYLAARARALSAG
ncbi:MAG: hypothetical protein NZ898_13700 [Myxococcota bacterium]|nr:hypothetical protein [Myxococcota bacterium]